MKIEKTGDRALPVETCDGGTVAGDAHLSVSTWERRETVAGPAPATGQH